MPDFLGLSPSCWLQRPKTPRRRPPPALEMSRPRSESAGPAAAARSRRRRALTYDDLPKEIKTIVLDCARPAPFTKEAREIIGTLPFTNETLRVAVKAYFEDGATCERRHGKIGTWDVGRVTDMSRLFYGRANFNEARAGAEEDVSSRRASRRDDSTPRASSTRASIYIRTYGRLEIERRTSAPGTRHR